MENRQYVFVPPRANVRKPDPREVEADSYARYPVATQRQPEAARRSECYRQSADAIPRTMQKPSATPTTP